MEKNLRKACYEQKLEFIDDALLRIRELILTHELTFKKPNKKRLDHKKKDCEISNPTFSDYKEMLGRLLGPWNIGDAYSFIRKSKHRHLEFETLYYAYSKHIFSDDPYAFFNEFFELFIAFSIVGEKHDPRGDLGLMKALFHAGKMVERLEHEGMKRSDIPAKAGRSKRKGYIDEQIYFNLLNSDQVTGKTRNAVCEKIRKEALKREQGRATPKNEKPKKVKAVKSIRKLLKPNLDKLFS